MDDATAEAHTSITHGGDFKANRLQFGISFTSPIFQRFIDNRLTAIPGVLLYFDDILVVGLTDKDLELKIKSKKR